MTRLGAHTRNLLPAHVRQPAYDRDRCGVGILHLGSGAFHRAHQAAYTDAVLALEPGDWRIRGVSLRHPATRDALAPQDGLYLLRSMGGQGDTRLIGALADNLVAPEDPHAVRTAIADPRIRVITLTITESGYLLGADGELDWEHPEVRHDLAQPGQPRTAIGHLAAGVALRARNGAQGLTLISCDNLSANGRKLESALLSFMQEAGERAGAAWVRDSCQFPGTMVDRIVPAVSNNQKKLLEHDLGLCDEAAVFTEPFSQWVIEARTAGPVPAWERAGAEWVSDVTPFEHMKLRLLNAAHSILAWCGLLIGMELIGQTVARPAIRRFVQYFHEREAVPSLSLPPGYDVQAYCRQLFARFDNLELPHRNQQIATDSSVKLRQRILPVLRHQVERGGPMEGSCLALAMYLACVQASADVPCRSGSFDDPLRCSILALLAETGSGGIRECLRHLDPALVKLPTITERVSHWTHAIRQRGLEAALESLDA